MEASCGERRASPPILAKGSSCYKWGGGLVLIDFFLGGGGFFFLFLYSLGPEGFVG